MRYQFLTVTVPVHDEEGKLRTLRVNFAPRKGDTSIDRRHVRKLLRKHLAVHFAGVTSAQCAQMIAHGKHHSYEEVAAAFKQRLNAMANRLEDDADADEDGGHTEGQAGSIADPEV